MNNTTNPAISSNRLCDIHKDNRATIIKHNQYKLPCVECLRDVNAICERIAIRAEQAAQELQAERDKRWQQRLTQPI